jgi:hypothetical protein
MLLDTVLTNDRQVRPRRKYDAYAHNETEAAVAARLAILEARDPSQRRPTPKANANNNVDWIDFN